MAFYVAEVRRVLSVNWTRNFKFNVSFVKQQGYYYHHLDIFEPHQRYLGFAWEVNSNPSYFVFTVMPFGLATACYAFTKLIWPLVKCWRGWGLCTVLYLDDDIVAVKGKENADRENRQVQLDLANAGLIANNGKSQWVPIKKLTWLGFQIELEERKLSVPEQKLMNLVSQLNTAKEAQAISAIVLASMIRRKAPVNGPGFRTSS